PSAELPLALLALQGRVVLRNRRKRRVLAAEEFFTGMLTTAREPDELVEEVRFPLAGEDEFSAFAEFASRHGDFANVAAAAVRRAVTLRLAGGGVADRPRAVVLPLQAGAARQAALNDFAWDLDAQDDGHASAVFRRHL